MEKELLTIEFRYHVIPKSEYSSDYDAKTITIGVYDTFEEAIKEGNNIIKQLSSRFKHLRGEFGTKNGPFGSSTRLVADCFSGYPHVFCKITKLKFEDVEDVMNEAFAKETEYRKLFYL
jgi:hypothetical protein